MESFGDGLAGAAALVVAGVLTVSAIAKWLAPASTSADFGSLHLPFPRLLARLVPVVELAVATALIVRPSTGASAALVLLVAFTTVVVAALRRGEPVRCACFGSVSARPISGATVRRNVALIALALCAIATGRDGQVFSRASALPTALAAGTLTLIGVCGSALESLRNETGAVFGGRAVLARWSDRTATR